MSYLKVYKDSDPSNVLIETGEHAHIAEVLKGEGVRFEQWSAAHPVTIDSTQEQVLEAYKADIDRLKKEGGYVTADVINLRETHPDKDALRKKFLSEHRHSEDEVRFFVEGQGLFCLHLGEKVYAVTCKKGDLISVPASSKHWFDMGDRPNFAAIRLFTNPDGWVANFTGDGIADQFPKLAY